MITPSLLGWENAFEQSEDVTSYCDGERCLSPVSHQD